MLIFQVSRIAQLLIQLAADWRVEAGRAAFIAKAARVFLLAINQARACPLARNRLMTSAVDSSGSALRRGIVRSPLVTLAKLIALPVVLLLGLMLQPLKHRCFLESALRASAIGRLRRKLHLLAVQAPAIRNQGSLVARVWHYAALPFHTSHFFKSAATCS